MSKPPILTAEMVLGICCLDRSFLPEEYEALAALQRGHTICVDAAQYQRQRESHAELTQLMKIAADYMRSKRLATKEVCNAIATAEALIEELK